MTLISKSVSGFIEWLPKVKKIEELWIRRIAEQARLSGFVPIETAAVEYLKTLELKGEIDKEIYCLSKPGAATATKDLALHYDLTVPIARFVTEHYGELSFPFKRYQIQKVWRGERPQFGRYREFYQADIDIIDQEVLPQFYDAEVVTIGVAAMLQMHIPEFRVGVSNRKIYEGYLLGLGITEPVPVLRLIDKLDKVGADGVQKLLVEGLGLDGELARRSLLLAGIKWDSLKPQALCDQLGVHHELFIQGLNELQQLLLDIELSAEPQVRAVIKADLSFVRGFDYYTGSIFEGKFTDGSGYGSICSGGRYDNLTQGFGSRKLPGVGFSIGVTRILAKLAEQASTLPDYPGFMHEAALILVEQDGGNAQLLALAKALKGEGLSVKVLAAKKLKKGLQVAARADAPVAIFLFDELVMLKHLGSGTQQEFKMAGLDSGAVVKQLRQWQAEPPVQAAGDQH